MLNLLKNKQALFLLALLLITSGVFISRNNNSKISLPNNVKNINALEFDKLAQNNDAFILDVHTPEQNHIEGTDQFIPFTEINDNLDKLPENKNTPILVYCRSGNMSTQASKDLISLGYTNVYNLEGGIIAYNEANTNISISPLSQDLGTVIYGDITKTEFKLTNNTSEDLTITKISTSCSCTSAQAKELFIRAKQSTTITVSFNPAIHKDDTDLGDLTRTIYINTDNINFPLITAEITANVIKK